MIEGLTHLFSHNPTFPSGPLPVGEGGTAAAKDFFTLDWIIFLYLWPRRFKIGIMDGQLTGLGPDFFKSDY